MVSIGFLVFELAHNVPVAVSDYNPIPSNRNLVAAFGVGVLLALLDNSICVSHVAMGIPCACLIGSFLTVFGSLSALLLFVALLLVPLAWGWRRC